jgi:hypothetical protein
MPANNAQIGIGRRFGLDAAGQAARAQRPARMLARFGREIHAAPPSGLAAASGCFGRFGNGLKSSTE